jgi:hypothetical protein
MVKLQRGERLRIATVPTTVTAHGGTVWITEPANLRYLWLQPGESLHLAGQGRVLIEALTDSTISFDT